MSIDFSAKEARKLINRHKELLRSLENINRKYETLRSGVNSSIEDMMVYATLKRVILEECKNPNVKKMEFDEVFLMGLCTDICVVSNAMLKARSGSIINMSSIVGIHGQGGQVNYSASKGGMDAFRHILCVGNSFLLRRISLYAAKLGFPTERLQYFGVWDKEGRNIGPDSWWKSEVAVQRVMAEVERIGKYYKDGNMSIF